MRKQIILFDGVCNLCNRAVNFIIRRDKADLYRFTPLQSETGHRLLKERQLYPESVDTLILLVPGEAYYFKSTAALKIGQSFGGPWRLLGLFLWIPAPLRDAVYNLIASNRYSWFGKKERCMVPTAELEKKFLTTPT